MTPLLQEVLDLVDKSNLYKYQICKKAGVHDTFLLRIQSKKGYPRVDTLEAVLTVLGYRLKLEKLATEKELV